MSTLGRINARYPAAECRRDTVASLGAVFPVCLVLLLFGYVVAVPNQTLDIFRDIAQKIALGPIDPDAEGLKGQLVVWRETILGLSALFALSATVWLVASPA